MPSASSDASSKAPQPPTPKGSWLSTVGIALGGVLFFGLMVMFMLNSGLEGMVGGGRRAAEKSAVSRLRTFLWAQDTLKQGRYFDRNGDGVGEFGYLRQLAGQVAPPNLKRLSPPILMDPMSELNGSTPQTVLLDGGFCHVMYLAGPGGAGVTEPSDGAEAAGSIDPALASRFWIAYAWPLEIDKSGRKAFFINQDEEIWETDNTGPNQGYSGLNKRPLFDAALPRPDLAAVPIEGQPHGDGGVWIRWKGKKARTGTH